MAQEEIIFPNNIRTIRLGRGMKMTELARQTGLSLSAVSKIEKGVRRLNQKQLLNICKILQCKLSDIFIKESDDVANKWQTEIKRRLSDNEHRGLKVFGLGLRKIRQNHGKTIAQAAKDAGMTLSVYHKIEIGQREIYQDEIEPLAKSFALTADAMFDQIANLYKSGDLAKQMNKVKERVKSVLVPDNPMSGIDIQSGLYGAKLYDSARRKLVPVFGNPDGRAISFKRDDTVMIVAPTSLVGRKSIYAVVPNTKRVGGFIPEKSYVFVDAAQPAAAGDLALCLDVDFDELDSKTVVHAQIAAVHADSKGKLYGTIVDPQEKIVAKTMHRVVLILAE